MSESAPPILYVQQPSILPKVLIGVVVVLVLMYFTNTLGLKTFINNAISPAQDSPPNNPQPIITSAPPIAPTVLPSAQIKIIEIEKNTINKPDVPPPGENDGWRTFQVGEVRVFTESGELSRADFESAIYVPSGGDYATMFSPFNAIDGDLNTFSHTSFNLPIHQLILTLKAPQKISRIEVHNRADCCQHRLDGSVLRIRDLNGTVVKQFALNANQIQVINL